MMTKYAKPPDGGYGWVVVAASFFSHVLQYGVVWTVGVFYVIFLDKIDASEPAIALISSLNTATYYVTGPLAGVLTNRYGARPITMIGGLIGSLGLFLSTFSQNVYHFYATFGIITGFGLGLAYIPSISIVAQYFGKKRTIALGFAVSGVGFGTFVFPPMIRHLVECYGWRSTLLMTSAVCMHICLCGSLFRPIHIMHLVSNPSVKEKTLNPKMKTTKKGILGNLNVHIFFNVHYLLLCLNNVSFCFGLSVVYVHLSEYARTIGFTGDQGAWLFSVLGIFNFAGRIGLGLVAHVPSVNSTLLYLVCFSTAGVATAFLPIATSLPALMTYAAAFGFLSAALGTLLPQVIVTILDLNLLTNGYGYVLIFEAIGTLLGAPVAGWLYVSTRVYASSFYLGGAAMILSGAFMILPWRKPRRLSNAESQEVEADSTNLNDLTKDDMKKAEAERPC